MGSPAKPYVIALTGGPCAGKTTLLESLAKRDSLGGRRLLFVPEAATILVQQGHVIGQDVREFQTVVMRLQLKLEGEALREAEASGDPCAIVCDRGTLDGGGYCPGDMFESIAAELGQHPAMLARRYDLVVHLVSAALEAPDAYTTGNNAARHESLEEAVVQEHRTRAAWAAHPNRVIIGSTTGFQAKIDAALSTIEQALSS